MGAGRTAAAVGRRHRIFHGNRGWWPYRRYRHGRRRRCRPSVFRPAMQQWQPAVRSSLASQPQSFLPRREPVAHAEPPNARRALNLPAAVPPASHPSPVPPRPPPLRATTPVATVVPAVPATLASLDAPPSGDMRSASAIRPQQPAHRARQGRRRQPAACYAIPQRLATRARPRWAVTRLRRRSLSVPADSSRRAPGIL